MKALSNLHRVFPRVMENDTGSICSRLAVCGANGKNTKASTAGAVTLVLADCGPDCTNLVVICFGVNATVEGIPAYLLH
jgi:hypothetical protein